MVERNFSIVEAWGSIPHTSIVFLLDVSAVLMTPFLYQKPTQQERATEEQHNDTKITHKDEVLFLTIRYETHTPAKLQGRQPTTHKIHTHYSERAARLNAKF